MGPFFWYARSSFSEMLSAFFALSLFLICLKGSSRKKHFFWLLIASLAKEVAFPFMFVLGVLGIYLSKSEKKNSKKLRWQDFLGLGAGALSAMLLNFAHNYFRYGSIINASYVQSIHFVPDLRTQASFFVGLFFSGNGGWIPFWPLAALCFLSALIWGRGRVKVAALTCTVLLGGLVFGFSRWAYPFGWVCWGPRFFMPWIPVFLFAIFSAEPEFFEKQLLKIKDWGRAVLAALVLLVSYPHALAVFSFTFVYSLFWPDTTCPKPVIIEQDQVYYFQCIEHYIWSKGSLLFQAFRFAWYEPGLDNYAIFPALLLVIVWLGLFLRLFQELDRARNHALS